mmetsp:Transcript_20232/g.62852  ORF Transcript_20232/g.62852 Transcript_20232/m.62852 type:complete len:252 (+) Transcript_20232:139-894(+)
MRRKGARHGVSCSRHQSAQLFLLLPATCHRRSFVANTREKNQFSRRALLDLDLRWRCRSCCCGSCALPAFFGAGLKGSASGVAAPLFDGGSVSTLAVAARHLLTSSSPPSTPGVPGKLVLGTASGDESFSLLLLLPLLLLAPPSVFVRIDAPAMASKSSGGMNGGGGDAADLRRRSSIASIAAGVSAIFDATSFATAGSAGLPAAAGVPPAWSCWRPRYVAITLEAPSSQSAQFTSHHGTRALNASQKSRM